jgi:hypothetical protein
MINIDMSITTKLSALENKIDKTNNPQSPKPQESYITSAIHQVQLNQQELRNMQYKLMCETQHQKEKLQSQPNKNEKQHSDTYRSRNLDQYEGEHYRSRKAERNPDQYEEEHYQIRSQSRDHHIRRRPYENRNSERPYDQSTEKQDWRDQKRSEPRNWRDQQKYEKWDKQEQSHSERIWHRQDRREQPYPDIRDQPQHGRTNELVSILDQAPPTRWKRQDQPHPESHSENDKKPERKLARERWSK